MLTSIEKALKLSEIREKLNDLNAVTDPTEAQQTEERDLLASQKTTETEYRAALTAEADEHAIVPVDGEDREYRALLGRGNVGRILTAFVEHRSVDRRRSGATAASRPGVESDPARHAASAGRASRGHDRTGRTSARQSNRPSCRYSRRASGRSSGRIARPSRRVWLPFRSSTTGRTWAGRIRLARRSTKRPDRFRRSLLTPGGFKRSYFYKRVDAARFPVIDLALRQALNGGLEEKLDQELIAGTEGLLTGTNLANHAAAAVTTFASYLSAFGHSRVDGRYAAALSDVRAIAGSATYAHMGNQYRSNNADYSALDSHSTRKRAASA